MRIIFLGGLCAVTLLGATTNNYFAKDLDHQFQKIFVQKTHVVAQKHFPVSNVDSTKIKKEKLNQRLETETLNKIAQKPPTSQSKSTPPKPNKQTFIPKKEATLTPSTNTNSTQTNKPKTTPSTTSEQLSVVEKEVVHLVNIEREKRGLQPLTISPQISDIARKKSNDMKIHNYFDHQSPTYGSPFEMLQQFGVSYSSAGENIAAGQQTAQEVMNGWMNSEGHRANILNPSFTHIGVGTVTGGNYGIYWTQLFISK